MIISEELKKSVSIVHLNSGETIIGSVVSINPNFLVMAFPVNRNITGSFMREADNQFFQIAHSDYAIFKSVNSQTADRYFSFIPVVFNKDEFAQYIKEFDHIKEHEKKPEPDKVTYH